MMFQMHVQPPLTLHVHVGIVDVLMECANHNVVLLGRVQTF